MAALSSKSRGHHCHFTDLLLFATGAERYSGDVGDLFWSYRLFFRSQSVRTEILNNIWLFVPLGAILYRLWPNLRILIIPVALSLCIELIQYCAGIGLAEFDDVISNGLGALMGYLSHPFTTIASSSGNDQNDTPSPSNIDAKTFRQNNQTKTPTSR